MEDIKITSGSCYINCYKNAIMRLNDDGCDLVINMYNYEILNSNLKNLFIHMLKSSDNAKLNILNGMDYYLMIQDNCIFKGKYITGTNIFPVENIPLNNLKYHNFSIYFELPNIKYKDIAEYICCLKYNKCENIFSNFGDIMIDWPNILENPTKQNQLVIKNGLGGTYNSHNDYINYDNKEKNKDLENKLIKINMDDIKIYKINLQLNDIVYIKPYSNAVSVLCCNNYDIVLEPKYFKFSKKSNNYKNYIIIPYFLFLGCDIVSNIEIYCPQDCDKPFIELFGCHIKLIKTEFGYKSVDFTNKSYLNNLKNYEPLSNLYNEHNNIITNLKDNTDYILKFDKGYLNNLPRHYIALNILSNYLDNIVEIIKKSKWPKDKEPRKFIMLNENNEIIYNLIEKQIDIETEDIETDNNNIIIEGEYNECENIIFI